MTADLAMLIVLAIFITVGAVRGLFKSIMSMFSTLIAIGGASYIAGNYSSMVTEKVFPIFKEKIIEKVDLTEFIARLTADSAASGSLDTGFVLDPKNFVNLNLDYEKLLNDAALAFLGGVVKVVVFILAFVILLILLKLLIRLLDNVFELPVLKQFNRMGGALLGALEGALLIYLVVYVSGLVGITFFLDNAADSYILPFVTEHRPFDLISLLK